DIEQTVSASAPWREHRRPRNAEAPNANTFPPLTTRAEADRQRARVAASMANVPAQLAKISDRRYPTAHLQRLADSVREHQRNGRLPEAEHALEQLQADIATHRARSTDLQRVRDLSSDLKRWKELPGSLAKRLDQVESYLRQNKLEKANALLQPLRRE